MVFMSIVLRVWPSSRVLRGPLLRDNKVTRGSAGWSSRLFGLPNIVCAQTFGFITEGIIRLAVIQFALVAHISRMICIPAKLYYKQI